MAWFQPFRKEKINYLNIMEELITAVCYTSVMVFLLDIEEQVRDGLQYMIMGLIVLNFTIHLAFIVYSVSAKIISKCRKKGEEVPVSTNNEDSNISSNTSISRTDRSMTSSLFMRRKEMVAV